jgi:hypothetical protein
LSAHIADIRAAIAQALYGTFSAGWNVYPYLQSKPEVPSMEVVGAPMTFDLAMMGGNWDVQFTVRAMVQWSDAVSAQVNLDSLLEQAGSGVKACLEADRTLGGVVSSLRVVGVTEPKVYPLSGGESGALGVEFAVEVTPNG